MEITVDWELLASQITEGSKDKATSVKDALEQESSASAALQDRSLSALHYGGADDLGTHIRVGGLEGQYNLQLVDFEIDVFEGKRNAPNVTATDPGGLARTESFEIDVADLNEVATDIALDAGAIDENAAGATVGTISVIDPDAGDNHALSVSDDRFEIVGDQLKLKDGVSLDHEDAAQISVEVTATDPGGLARTESFEIDVADLNEVATDIALDAGAIDENAAGATVGTISVIDPDAGDNHALSVSDDRFEIVGDQLKLKDGVSLDHEDAAQISVEVTATDPGGLARTESFEIDVADLNEVATDIALDAGAIDENAAGATVGTISVIDPDAGDNHALSVSDDRFEIVGDRAETEGRRQPRP